LPTEHELPAELAAELEDSFFQGPMFNEKGLRSLNEVQIARIGGLKVVIQFDEHPPPHFEVRYDGKKASFSIEDGARLPKIRGLENFDFNVKKWWKDNKCLLIKTWNQTRPSDCQVGFMAVPPECIEQAAR